MKSIFCALITLAGTSSWAQATGPSVPSVEWQASAQNVAARVQELVKYGETNGADDAKLADAVTVLKEKTAAKSAAPAWSKRTSWIEGSGANRVYFGVGVFTGKTSNRHLAFIVAENRARIEIAKLLKVTIVRKSEANGWRSVTVTTAATLANVVIVDWFEEGPTIYALAAYSKPVNLESDAPWIP